jgi:hypothetical protein
MNELQILNAVFDSSDALKKAERKFMIADNTFGVGDPKIEKACAKMKLAEVDYFKALKAFNLFHNI